MREMGSDGEDITTNTLFPNSRDQHARAKIFAKEDGIFSGKEEVIFFFSSFFSELSFSKEDGEPFQKGEILLEIKGNVSVLLKAERVLLNFLMRMCGISSFTKDMQKEASPVAIAATRKTLWGALDKKAVSVGGGYSHRIGLFDAFLVKENHLTLWKTSIDDLFKRVSEFSKKSHVAFFEIEVETEQMFTEVLLASEKFQIRFPVIIMFDNFSPQAIHQCMRSVSSKRKVFFEASGGITAKNISEYAKTGVDILSLGALTHTAKPIDLSFRIVS